MASSKWRCQHGHTYTSPRRQTVCAYGRCGGTVECVAGPMKRKRDAS